MADKVNLTELFGEIDESFEKAAVNKPKQTFDTLPDGEYWVQIIKVELVPSQKKLVWVFKVIDDVYKGCTIDMWTNVTGEYAWVTKSSLFYAGYPIYSALELVEMQKPFIEPSTQILDCIEQITQDMPEVKVVLKTKGEYQNKKIVAKKNDVPKESKPDWKEETLSTPRSVTAEDIKKQFS